jgi:outer membrane protein TolC
MRISASRRASAREATESKFPIGITNPMNYRIRLSRRIVALTMLLATALLAVGCSPTQPFYFCEDTDLSHYVGMATNIEYPDVNTCSLQEVNDPPAPLTISNPKFDEFWDLCLADAVRIALDNGKVLRSLGARSFATPNIARTNIPGPSEVLTSQPAAAITVYEPALFETDPIFGVEGALSAFDAQMTASMFWDKHDEPQNIKESALVITPRVFQQDLGTFQEGITKTSVTGAEFSFLSNTTYNSNNNVNQDNPSSWSQNFEFGVKQPLLQGAGTLYNRIAGPFDPLRGIGTYLQYDGVIIARIRTDIRLADFEAGVRNFVSDVENAYWELYFAYRNLEATKSGRDAALQTWRKVRAKFDTGALGGEKDKEAQAREQYFLFRASLETALSDLYKAENRLRYLMGLAATDCRMIRPCDEPTDAKVMFDWCEVHAETMCRSVELRQQKWRIKQREMELIASKNLLLPRLDATGKYRFLGIGQDLIDYPGQAFRANAVTANSIQGTDAMTTLADGAYQEWELGLQFSMPIGFRQPLAAVRNAQLTLARERAILQDEELEVSHQLSDAIRDIDTDYVLAQTNFNRRVAAQQQVDAVQSLYDVGAGGVTLDLVLEAQRTRADAEAAYYRSLVDYNKAIMTVHFRKGSLLEYNGVYLAEGPWPAKAYFDAKRRARQRDAGLYLDYGYSRPAVFSQGPFPQFQHTEGTSGNNGPMPTEASGAQPEEVVPPRPAAPGGPKPNFELPAPIMRSSEGASAASRPRMPQAGASPVGRMPAGGDVSATYNSARPTAPQNATKSPELQFPSASAAKIDTNVLQASAEAPFDWGDLSLGKAGAADSASSGFSPPNNRWKSANGDPSDAVSSANANWKSAGR